MAKSQRSIFALIIATAVVAGVLINRQAVRAPKSHPAHGGATNVPRATDPVTGSAAQAPLSFPAVAAALMTPDSPTSSHPAERAVASGLILDTRIERTDTENRWMASEDMQINGKIAEGAFTVQLATSDLDAMPAAFQFLAGHP